MGREHTHVSIKGLVCTLVIRIQKLNIKDSPVKKRQNSETNTSQRNIYERQPSSKSGTVMPRAWVFFFHITLAIWSPLRFDTNFRTVCCSSVKNAGNILIGFH